MTAQVRRFSENRLLLNALTAVNVNSLSSIKTLNELFEWQKKFWNKKRALRFAGPFDSTTLLHLALPATLRSRTNFRGHGLGGGFGANDGPGQHASQNGGDNQPN